MKYKIINKYKIKKKFLNNQTKNINKINQIKRKNGFFPTQDIYQLIRQKDDK